jgi:hypothetical protein
MWMVNFRVRDLDAMAGQLRARASESKWTSSITEMVALPACATVRAIRLSSGNLRVALPYVRDGLRAAEAFRRRL